MHTVYHPLEKRFCKQVTIQGCTEPDSFYNVRDDPDKPLPKNVAIPLVSAGPCMSEGKAVADILASGTPD